ncbi:hypothetical protein M409DRAFT_62705 [Zasmidium cellare ATCC 36951]|uniref:AB hydrolase-1 domain-containing protein n=1 Tax=Zasmidium cellare ATCC 36951 TaxID=1080233 RepID=A0A6A6D0V3_ZASCE|nr:uncharacterized protein M409DRAFT_62705 [Zasmidium cellare ATCC 36951]KAF2173097.1 hypothetical protein M409DRAFT_62705 [Zasmidium cellare ATCC 36951]
MPSKTKTIHVPHLGGIDAGYQMSENYDASKPTLVMVNSFTTSAELYRKQFEDEALTGRMNLLAVELLGHGETRTDTEHWTYWDTAIMNLQVLDALGITGKVFVLGTSQGGWITVRMALLAPERIAGIIPLGTSMDYESPRTRELGCWNGPEALAASIDAWTTAEPTPEFKPSEEYCGFLLESGFGGVAEEAERRFWIDTIQSNYTGDAGRRRIRMAAINLRERDGLHGRLFDVRCPVLWLHGTADQVYSVANAQEEIRLFVNSPDARVRVVEGGAHFLSFSNPRQVDEAVGEFVGRYA